MTVNLTSVNRHDKILDENWILVTKLSNLLFIEDLYHVKLIIATIFGRVINNSENNKSTGLMLYANSDEYRQYNVKHDLS